MKRTKQEYEYLSILAHLVRVEVVMGKLLDELRDVSYEVECLYNQDQEDAGKD